MRVERCGLIFVPCSHAELYQQLLLNVDEDSTQLTLEEKLKEEIFQRRPEHLQSDSPGKRRSGILLIPEKLKSFGNITEVLDETKPAYAPEALQKRSMQALLLRLYYLLLEKNRIQLRKRHCFTDCRHCWRLRVRGEEYMILKRTNNRNFPVM